MTKKRKSTSTAKRYKCTCHRVHKKTLFSRKCKVHRHLYYKPLKRKTIKMAIPTTKSPSKKMISMVENTVTVIKTTNKTKGISPHVNKQLLLDAIHRIQQCSDVEQCTEIKNYITVNVCDVNSSDKDIIFYLSYLSHSEQKTIYDKTMNFTKKLE